MKTELLRASVLGMAALVPAAAFGQVGARPVAGQPPARFAAVAPVKARDCLGTQIWIERDDTRERIDRLFASAAAAGHGWVRIFLMWPWIEATPGQWDFQRFDWAFDAAARHGLRIKATLTCNSGPWHVGTPSMLHSHTGFLAPEQREPMRRYIRRCVERYYRHPALGQWILWNEPGDSADPTPERLAFWQAWLQQKFTGNIQTLNREWLTGYREFREVPFPNEVPNLLQRGHAWNQYGPWLADYQARRDWLLDELKWVRAEVRRIDGKTETCVNPSSVFANHAAVGYDFTRLAEVVDVLGASYHPAWHFTFASRPQFPGLIAAGVKYLASAGDGKPVEVTEVQTGNTVNSSTRPNAVQPDELARFHLAALACGANSVTGWCFNQRREQNEAGDWALLDNLDEPSPRSRMIRRLHDTLDAAFAQTGRWRPAANRALVVGHPKSQALEAIEAHFGGNVNGRLAADGARSQALLTTILLQCGIPAAPAYLDRLDRAVTPDGLVVASHVVAWDEADGRRLLRFAEQGGRLLLDAASGRRDSAARMHYPWPGGLAPQIGLRARELESNAEGHKIELAGRPAGKFLLARLQAVFDDTSAWSAWDQPRFQDDGEPLVWQRSYGKGRIILVRGYLGASYLYDPDTLPAVRYILRRAGEGLAGAVRPLPMSDCVYAIPVDVERGELTVVLTEGLSGRQNRPLRLQAARAAYHDFWSGADLATGPDGELVLEAKDGIAILWRPGIGR
jgi:beta-galactosidase